MKLNSVDTLHALKPKIEQQFLFETNMTICFVLISKIHFQIKPIIISNGNVYLRRVSSSHKTTYLICLSSSFVCISSQTFCNMTSVLAQCPCSVFSTFVLIVGTAGSVLCSKSRKLNDILGNIIMISLLFSQRNRIFFGIFRFHYDKRELKWLIKSNAFTSNITVISNVFGLFAPCPLNDWHTIFMVVWPCFHSKHNLINRHINWSLNDKNGQRKMSRYRHANGRHQCSHAMILSSHNAHFIVLSTLSLSLPTLNLYIQFNRIRFSLSQGNCCNFPSPSRRSEEEDSFTGEDIICL